MDKTKFFTKQVTSGSRGEASDENMQRRMTDFGVEEMPDDRTFFVAEGGGGFVGRSKAWEPYVACRDAVGEERLPAPVAASPHHDGQSPEMLAGISARCRPSCAGRLIPKRNS